jgi:hypothetical protein
MLLLDRMCGKRRLEGSLIETVPPPRRPAHTQLYEERREIAKNTLANPNAETPLPASMFNWPDVVYHTMGDDGVPIDTAKDGNLYWRMTLTLPPDLPEAEVQKHIAKANKYVEEELAKEFAQESEND